MKAEKSRTPTAHARKKTVTLDGKALPEKLDDFAAGINAAREAVGVAEYAINSNEPPSNQSLAGALAVVGLYLETLLIDVARYAEELRAKPVEP